jgi:hypothetical protein
VRAAWEDGLQLAHHPRAVPAVGPAVCVLWDVGVPPVIRDLLGGRDLTGGRRRRCAACPERAGVVCSRPDGGGPMLVEQSEGG